VGTSLARIMLGTLEARILIMNQETLRALFDCGGDDTAWSARPMIATAVVSQMILSPVSIAYRSHSPELRRMVTVREV
jgi:hypothetical protein